MPGMKDIDYNSIILRAKDDGDDSGRLLENAARELRDLRLIRADYHDDLDSAPTSLTISLIGIVDEGIFHQGFRIDHDEEVGAAMRPIVPHLPKHGVMLPNKRLVELSKTRIVTIAAVVIGHSNKGSGVFGAWHPKLSEVEAMSFMRYVLGETLGEKYFEKHDPRNAN